MAFAHAAGTTVLWWPHGRARRSRRSVFQLSTLSGSYSTDVVADQYASWSMKAPLDEPAKGQLGSPGCIGGGAVPIAAPADGELSKSNISSRSLAFASRAVRLGSEKRFSRSARIEV
jgi:hypothetical protein